MKSLLSFIMLASAIITAAPAAFAGSREVPNVLSFNSSLFDDGGNPVSDGSAGVTFRITDVAGQVLYEEHQTVEALRGQVSALVGAGLTPAGAPTGGIPPSVFDPQGARYLEAQLDGMPPTPSMEIASVPYATYSAQALGAAKGAIDSAAIADGSIAYEDLSHDFVTELANELTGGRGAGELVLREELKVIYRDPAGAQSIGVLPTLVYSGENNLQGVLKDLDTAIKRRDEKIDSLASARTTEDVRQDAALLNEAAARTSEDQLIRAQSQVVSDAVVSLEQQLHPTAWGSVKVAGKFMPIEMHGANASVAGIGDWTSFRVTFAQPMSSENYAVIVTPQSAGIIMQGMSDKTAGGFTVNLSMTAPFDFIVIGP